MSKQETIYKKLTALLPDLQNMKPGQSIKMKASGFMDLSVDMILNSSNMIIISMTHYYEQNGDLVPDPDMEIAIYPQQKMAEARSYQDTYTYQVVYPEPGKVYPKLKAELNSFLNQWLSNLKLQGHKIIKD